MNARLLDSCEQKDFVVSLLFVKTVLTKCRILTKLLEQEDLNAVAALNYVETTIVALDALK